MERWAWAGNRTQFRLTEVRTNAGYRGTAGAMLTKALCEGQGLRVGIFSVIRQGRSLCNTFARVPFYTDVEDSDNTIANANSRLCG